MNPSNVSHRSVSLFRKIALPINIISIFVLTVIGIFLVRSNTNSVKEAMESKVQSLTLFLSTASAPYLVNFDLYAINGFANQAIQDSDISYVRFYRDSQVLVEAKDSSLTGSDSILEIKKDIILSGNKIGEVLVGYSPKRIEASVSEIIWIDIFMIICEQIALLIGIVYIIRKVTSPITDLTASIRKISKSSDYSVRLTSKDKNFSSVKELQIFIQEFNHMIEEVQRRDLEILNANHRLEEKVVSRTKELQESIETLKNTQMSLIESSKFASLGEMAGGVAHEINNPLAIICISSAAIVEKTKMQEIDRALVARYNDRIQSAIDRITKIIKSLKRFSRQTEGDAFQKEVLSEIIDDTLVFCEERFKIAGVLLKLNGYDKGLQLYCRSSEISQIILNLLNNAFDAVQSLHDHDRWVEISVTNQARSVKISVINGGPKIDQGIQSRIFDPFYTTKPVGQGTGLGLSISKGIAQSHRGFLSLDSSFPHTKFDLELPLIANELRA